MSESDRLKIRFARDAIPVKQRWKDDYKKFSHVFMSEDNVVSEEMIRPKESFTVHFKKGADYVIRRQFWPVTKDYGPQKDVCLYGPRMLCRSFDAVEWPVKKRVMKK